MLITIFHQKLNPKLRMVAEPSRGTGSNTLLRIILVCLADGAMATPSATLDTRLLGKPRIYTNKREDWPGFKFVLKSYVGAVSVQIRTKMEAAEKSNLPIALIDMGDETKQEASTLVFILTQVLAGSSLQLLMNAEPGNGFEAWRS